MSREEFISDRKERWDRLDRLLWAERLDGERWAELAALYRAVCADLSRAQALGLAEDVQRYLDELAGRAHNRLYGAREVGGVPCVADSRDREQVERVISEAIAAFGCIVGIEFGAVDCLDRQHRRASGGQFR